jgi:hypothetical protein
MAVAGTEGDDSAGDGVTTDSVGAVTDAPLEVIVLAEAGSVGGVAAKRGS